MKNVYLLIFLFAFISCSEDSMGSKEIMEQETTLITPRIGVGNLTFQNNGNQVIAEHGTYDMINVSATGGMVSFVMWYDNGLGFQLDFIDDQNFSLQELVDMTEELVDFDQKLISMVVMSPYEGATAEGIKLGSSKADVIAAYGMPDEVGSLSEKYLDLQLSVWYNNEDQVRRFDLGN